ncbi:hypothetical protein MTO96_001631 [Rhipicephalus appendiculatus]
MCARARERKAYHRDRQSAVDKGKGRECAPVGGERNVGRPQKESIFFAVGGGTALDGQGLTTVFAVLAPESTVRQKEEGEEDLAASRVDQGAAAKVVAVVVALNASAHDKSPVPRAPALLTQAAVKPPAAGGYG